MSPEARAKEYLLHLHSDDHVAVARQNIPAGMTLRLVDGREFVTREKIRMSHKVAIDPIAAEDPIHKYGQVIGFATTSILPRDHVHSHNLIMRDFGRNYDFCTEVHPVDFHDESAIPTFMGYERADGTVGTRNYVAVISSVNCSATVSKLVQRHFDNPAFKKTYPNVDGIIALTHKSGCCQQPGEPTDRLERVLLGMATHPNVFGYIVIGLGCEGMQVSSLRSKLTKDRALDERQFLVIQQVGGVRKTADAAIDALEKLLPLANAVERTPQTASKLVLGMQCGGSDGNSGITANPAVGAAADELIRCGGTAVLAETPEIFGAEHLLTVRAQTERVGEKLVALIRWWEQYARKHNATIDNNPTPRNKEGGLTTIYEKSLGAIAKAGQSPLSAVYNYGEKIDTPGLGFMDSPGYDPVSMTGLCAGGATLGVFTTGRGSVYGCKPMPVLKVATNTPLYSAMHEDMDLNAGTILDGEATIGEVGSNIFEQLLMVASGTHTKSEAQGIGDEEFAPWLIGPTF